MRFSTVALFVIVAALSAAPVVVEAQTTPPAGAEKEEASEGKTKRGRTRMPKNIPGVISLEEQVVIGRIQKPEVFYVLGRTDFAYKGLNLNRSFVERIRKSVRSNPF